MNDKELTQALASNLASTLPFQMAKQLFEKYCINEASQHVAKLDEEGKKSLHQEMVQLGYIKPEV